MTQNEVITTLQNEAKLNPVANAALHVFAIRKRARSQVTIQALAQRMRAEGYEFDNTQYAALLRLLAKLGFGRLDVDSKGRVKALRDIKTSLQSIGAAACGEKVELESFSPRNRFQHMAEVAAPKPKKAAAPQQVTGHSPIAISIEMNGKQVYIPVPKNLTATEIAELVTRMRG